uniref:Uncharacterized protein n=1 Tax=Alexandrium monilatum TaxID=311494 RepID=A0A7S4V0R8_9DINO
MPRPRDEASRPERRPGSGPTGASSWLKHRGLNAYLAAAQHRPPGSPGGPLATAPLATFLSFTAAAVVLTLLPLKLEGLAFDDDRPANSLAQKGLRTTKYPPGPNSQGSGALPAATGVGQLAMDAKGEAWVGRAGAKPDAGRGYNVTHYEKLWHTLHSQRRWPSEEAFSVLGPLGEDFSQAAEACALKELGQAAMKVAREDHPSWQSVQLQVHCSSPDDFCALHSCLNGIEGVHVLD